MEPLYIILATMAFLVFLAIILSSVALASARTKGPAGPMGIVGTKGDTGPEDLGKIHMVSRIDNSIPYSEHVPFHFTADLLNSALSHTLYVDMSLSGFDVSHSTKVILESNVEKVTPGTQIHIVVSKFGGAGDRFYVVRGEDSLPQGGISTWNVEAGWITQSTPPEAGNVGYVAASDYQGTLEASIMDITATPKGYIIRAYGFEPESL